MLLGGLRCLLAVERGDTVTITLADGTELSEPVAGFVDEPLTAVGYVSLEHLEATLEQPTISGALIQLQPDTDRDAAAQRLGSLPGAAAYFDNTSLAHHPARHLLAHRRAARRHARLRHCRGRRPDVQRHVRQPRGTPVELGTLNAAGLARGLLARLVAAENLLLTLIGLPSASSSDCYSASGSWPARRPRATSGPCTSTPPRSRSSPGVFVASLLAQLPVLRGLRRIDVARIVRERSL